MFKRPMPEGDLNNMCNSVPTSQKQQCYEEDHLFNFVSTVVLLCAI
jgi:hypothetical protein